MRASKSMPESNINKSNKWGSIYTDSGISLTSSDMTMTKQKDSISLSSSTSSSVSLKPMRSRMMLPECSTSAPLSKISSEEARRFVFNYFLSVEEINFRSSKSRMLPGTSSKRHYQQQPPLPQKNVVPPPLPAKNVSQPAPNAAPGASPVDTYVVYSYCDEDLPYRIRIPGRNTLTLKQCKENMPKKGNYRWVWRRLYTSKFLWHFTQIPQLFLQNHLRRWGKPNHPGRNQQRLRCAAFVRGQNHGDPQIGQLKPRPAQGTWVLTY